MDARVTNARWALIALCLPLLGPHAWAQKSYGSVNLVAAANGGKIIKVTSQQNNEEWAARNLIDGLHIEYVVEDGRPKVKVPKGPGGTDSYGWSSKGGKLPQEIIFAFKDEKPQVIGKVVVDPVSADPGIIGRWPKNIEVWVSETTPDGTYRNVGSFIVANKPIRQSFELNAPAKARYVMLRILSTHSPRPKLVSFGEFEVYPAVVGQDQLDELVRSADRLLAKLRRYRDSRIFEETNPPPGAARQPKNLAAAANGGRVVYVSSQAKQEDGTADPRWAASNLIDGKRVTFEGDVPIFDQESYGWSSENAQFPQDIIIAFAGNEPKLIDRIVVDPTTIDGYLSGRWLNTFELQVTTGRPIESYAPEELQARLTPPPDAEWKTVGRFSLQNRPAPQTFTFNSCEARYVRIRALSNQGSDKFVEAGEIEIFECIIPRDPVIQIASRWESLVEELRRYRDSVKYPDIAPPAAATRPPLAEATGVTETAADASAASRGSSVERSMSTEPAAGDEGPAEPSEPAAASVYPEVPGTIVRVVTARGEFDMALADDDMPVTVAAFKRLVQSKFYDGLTFQRVEDWLIQAGDPTGTTRTEPPPLNLETSDKWRHDRGALGMARLPSDRNSATCQWYVVKSDAHFLDGEYACFGRVVRGMDVVDNIQRGDKIESVSILRGPLSGSSG
ncbi:MAG: peptidylprolyl isomerase [Armatimonadota bacterium]